MDIDIIALYALAVLGPVLIFLTHYVVKGRTRDMTRLWFITFFSYTIYYYLAKSYNFFNDPRDIVFCFALLWPIAAILAFWCAELLTKSGSGVPFFKWMVYFIVAVIFAFLLDGATGMLQWYTYNPDKLANVSFVNPIGGLTVPALMPFLLGVLMIGVVFLVFNVYAVLRKKRIDETSSTLLLAALSIVMGGALWVITDLILSVVKSML
jgi:hypothetical protein